MARMIKVYRIAEDGRRLASGAFQALSENASLTVKLTARSVSGLPGRPPNGLEHGRGHRVHRLGVPNKHAAITVGPAPLIALLIPSTRPACCASA